MRAETGFRGPQWQAVFDTETVFGAAMKIASGQGRKRLELVDVRAAESDCEAVGV